LRGGAAGAQG